MPAAEVNTSLSASSNALSVLLKPLWHCRRPICLLTSALFRRLPVNVLNLRTTLAVLLYGTRAIRPPDGEILKKLTKVWTKFSKRVQSRRLRHSDESIMKVVSIGIGHSSPVDKKAQYISYVYKGTSVH